MFYFAITNFSEGGRKSLHASDSRPYPSSIFSTLLLRERNFLLLSSHKEYICNTNLDIGRPAAATCLPDLRNRDIEFLAPESEVGIEKGLCNVSCFPTHRRLVHKASLDHTVSLSRSILPLASGAKVRRRERRRRAGERGKIHTRTA